MRTAVIAMLALSLAPTASAGAQCSPERYTTTETDRFSGATTIKTSPIAKSAEPSGLGEDEFSLNLHALTDTKKNKLIWMEITYWNSHGDDPWRYAACHPVFILADGIPVEILRIADFPSTGGGSEMVTAELSAAAVAKLGAASKIEFKICNDELVASPEFVQAAHEFACKMAQNGRAKPAKGKEP